MASDYIIKRFFEYDRWAKALNTGVDKGIKHGVLRELATPQARIALYEAIRDGRYVIAPPRTAQIPKDTHGNYRTVYVNGPRDRVLLNIANDLLFELMPGSVHESCKSYISGMGCGKIARDVSRHITAMGTDIAGWKSDLSQYFDSVAIEHIDRAFDTVEARHGRSALIDLLRNYYHSEEYYDDKGNLQHRFMSLRQGCAVSAWLSDTLLYHIDEQLSQLDGYYVRYCDDMLFIGPDHERAMALLKRELAAMGLRLNPDKVETVRADRWFNFLGFSIAGRKISLSPRRVKKFQQAVDRKTRHATSAAQAAKKVCRLLYGPKGRCWAEQVLPVINSQSDIDTLNAYVMDSIRAAATGHRRIGGLGYNRDGRDGCVVRGRGRHVASNRATTPPTLEHYRSLTCMRNAMRTSRTVYDTLVRQM